MGSKKIVAIVASAAALAVVAASAVHLLTRSGGDEYTAQVTPTSSLSNPADSDNQLPEDQALQVQVDPLELTTTSGSPSTTQLAPGSKAVKDEGRNLLAECGSYSAKPATGSGVARTVKDQTQLEQALNAAQPGDTINLQAGTYFEIRYWDVKGHVSGTKQNPIVIQAAQGAKPVIDRKDFNAIEEVVRVEGVSHIQVRGLDLTGAAFGLNSQNAKHVLFEHNTVHHVGHNAVTINSDYSNPTTTRSEYVTARCNKVHHTGLHDELFGEAFYVGDGDDTTDSNHIVLELNEIFNVGGDIFDIKAGVTDVTIRKNYVHDLVPVHREPVAQLEETSLIIVGVRKANYGPANVVVENNIFSNAVKANGDGNNNILKAGHGGVVLRNNIFNNVGQNFLDNQIEKVVPGKVGAVGWGNPAVTDVHIYNNTFWGCFGSCVKKAEHEGTGNWIVKNNIVSGEFLGTNFKASEADFLGPVAGSANAGSGPGSGFRLKADSAAINKAQTLNGFSSDLYGKKRPTGSGWDFGAIESN